MAKGSDADKRRAKKRKERERRIRREANVRRNNSGALPSLSGYSAGVDSNRNTEASMASKEHKAREAQRAAEASDKQVGGEWRSVQTVTAFVDLLGVANALRDLDKIHDQSLDKEAATPLVVAAIGTVMRFRREFINCMQASDPTLPELPNGIPDEARRVFDESRHTDIRFHTFSDCIVVNTVINSEMLLGTARDILFLCHSLAYTNLTMLKHGVLTRGGVETGLAMDDGSQELLGSGLAHAYELESTIAEYPRICIGPRFLGLLQALEHEGKRDDIRGGDLFRAKAIAGIAERIRGLIVSDHDGVARLRLVLPELVAIYRQTGVDILLQIRQALDSAHAKAVAARNHRHLKKVVWTRNTIEGELRRPG